MTLKFEQKVDGKKDKSGKLFAKTWNKLIDLINPKIENHTGQFIENDKLQVLRAEWLENHLLHYENVSKVENKYHFKRASQIFQTEVLLNNVCFVFLVKESSTGVVTFKLNETPEKNVYISGTKIGEKFAGREDIAKVEADVTYIARYRKKNDGDASDDAYHLFPISAGGSTLKLKVNPDTGLGLLVDLSGNPVSIEANSEYKKGAIINETANEFWIFSDFKDGSEETKSGIQLVSESPGDDFRGNPLPNEQSMVFVSKNEETSRVNITTGYATVKSPAIFATGGLFAQVRGDSAYISKNEQSLGIYYPCVKGKIRKVTYKPLMWKGYIDHSFLYTDITSLNIDFSVEGAPDPHAFYFKYPGIYEISVQIQYLAYDPYSFVTKDSIIPIVRIRPGFWNMTTGVGIKTNGETIPGTHNYLIPELNDICLGINVQDSFANGDKGGGTASSPLDYYGGRRFITTEYVRVRKEDTGDVPWYFKPTISLNDNYRLLSTTVQARMARSVYKKVGIDMLNIRGLVTQGDILHNFFNNKYNDSSVNTYYGSISIFEHISSEIGRSIFFNIKKIGD